MLTTLTTRIQNAASRGALLRQLRAEDLDAVWAVCAGGQPSRWVNLSGLAGRCDEGRRAIHTLIHVPTTEHACCVAAGEDYQAHPRRESGPLAVLCVDLMRAVDVTQLRQRVLESDPLARREETANRSRALQLAQFAAAAVALEGFVNTTALDELWRVVTALAIASDRGTFARALCGLASTGLPTGDLHDLLAAAAGVAT